MKLGFLSVPQLEGVLAHQRQWGFTLGRSAVLCGFCTEAQVLLGLSKQLGLPPIHLDQLDLKSSFSPLIPERVASQHSVVPLRTSGARHEVLVVAMGPPASLVSQDVVRAISKKSRLEVYLASDEAIQRAIGRLYRGVNPQAHAEIEVGALGDVGATLKSGLVDQLGLSPRARLALEGVTRQHALAGNEVLRRMVELWAGNQPIPPPPALPLPATAGRGLGGLG